MINYYASTGITFADYDVARGIVGPDFPAQLEGIFLDDLKRQFYRELAIGGIHVTSPVRIKITGESWDFVTYRASVSLTIRYRTMLVAVTWRPVKGRRE